MPGLFAAGAPPFQNLANDASAGAVLCREWVDGTDHLPQQVIRLYNATGVALTVGAPYVYRVDGDEETNPKAITPAASTTGTVSLEYVVIATEATAAAAFGWFAIHGYANVLVDGNTDVAKDDFLELLGAATPGSLLKDGTAQTANSVAIACVAQAANSAVLTRCWLLGDRVTLAAA